MTSLAAQGVRFSFGAFITTWESEFGASRGQIASVSFASYLLYGLTQPAVGRLAERWGGRRVLLLGVLVTRWFRARRGLAFGLIEVGAATGQLIIVPGSVLLIARLGWLDTSMLFAAILCLIVLPLVTLLVHAAPEARGARPFGAAADETPAAPTSTDASPMGSPLATRRFWLPMLPFFICGTTTTGLMDTHLIPLAEDGGFELAVAGTAVAVLAGFNIAGTLISAVFADRFDPARMLGWIYVTRILSLAVLLVAADPVTLVLFAALFGLVDFATLAPTQLLASRLFERRGAGTVFGWLFMSHHLGSAFGSAVPGILHDLSGGYAVSLVGSMVLLGVGALMSFSLAGEGVLTPIGSF